MRRIAVMSSGNGRLGDVRRVVAEIAKPGVRGSMIADPAAPRRRPVANDDRVTAISSELQSCRALGFRRRRAWTIVRAPQREAHRARFRAQASRGHGRGSGGVRPWRRHGRAQARREAELCADRHGRGSDRPPEASTTLSRPISSAHRASSRAAPGVGQGSATRLRPVGRRGMAPLRARRHRKGRRWHARSRSRDPRRPRSRLAKPIAKRYTMA